MADSSCQSLSAQELIVKVKVSTGVDLRKKFAPKNCQVCHKILKVINIVNIMEFYEEFMKSYDEKLSEVKTEAAKKRQEDDVKILSVKAEKRNDVEILSAKAKTRAGQGISAGVPGSVMSDPEQAGTVEKPLEDGELGDIV